MACPPVAIGSHSEQFMFSKQPMFTNVILKPLVTAAEIQARNETTEVYICDIEAKSAQDLLHALRTIPGRDEVNVLHLRRFAKPEDLPPHTRCAKGALQDLTNKPNGRGKKVNIVTVLLAPVDLIPKLELCEIISRLKLSINNQPVQVRTVKVPANAPTSLEHAQQLSRDLWPTVFANTNPFGPHPTQVASSQARIAPTAGKWMSLASQLGLETVNQGFGVGVGAVLVETSDGFQEVVAGAGDARVYNNAEGITCGVMSEANPTGHAVMRALGILARKRRRIATLGDLNGIQQSRAEVEFRNEEPLTPLEQNIFEQDNLKANGYLALDLDVYVTHEPCLMCCMALVHSRIGRCVIGKWMPRTGGLGCAEPKQQRAPASNTSSGKAMTDSQAPKMLGKNVRMFNYGLFWRPDLNWRFFAWSLSNSKGKSDFFHALPHDTHV